MVTPTDLTSTRSPRRAHCNQLWRSSLLTLAILATSVTAAAPASATGKTLQLSGSTWNTFSGRVAGLASRIVA